MQLDEKKTYRTRDGSRTGIRVRPFPTVNHWPWRAVDGVHDEWRDNGSWALEGEHRFDLVEEQPADRLFSYDACPVGPDGRRRAVTRDGRDVVLLCENAPRHLSIIGMIEGDEGLWAWAADGSRPDCGVTRNYLLVPPPSKRVVWVNLYEEPSRATVWHASQEEADAAKRNYGRLGNRAYPIEIDAE